VPAAADADADAGVGVEQTPHFVRVGDPGAAGRAAGGEMPRHYQRAVRN